MKGKFITFEGGEGVGKTTLIKKLEEYLTSKGIKVLVTREPGGTEMGQSVRDILLYKKQLKICGRSEILLFLADRSQHVFELIQPALDQGIVVLCDRYNDSTMAYQGGGRGATDDKTLKFLCEFGSFNLVPDLTFYLDLDPVIGLERVQKGRKEKDRLEQEKIEFHNKIRESFKKIAKENKERFRVVDASKSAQEVFEEVLTSVKPCLVT